ncbi:hypothetical protein HU200_050517 [Digitaria exilis]|uniref:Uncharacterized protein n=1 Tax=Digitaria exilis TaxID=1010633 RepID=A0A835ANU1_9POAL|nr:hypothetical protein HU200_050517 [Digitaria exilis]
MPAWERRAQTWVMNSPPLASCSTCPLTLSDGATYRIISAQNSAITFQRSTPSCILSFSSLPSFNPLTKIVSL